MASAWSQKHLTGACGTTPDARVAKLAAGQWGVVTVAQLYECGLSRREVQVRGARGILHALYTGVFAWGHHNIATEGRFLAAVMACGPYAVLSHYSAAVLHALLTWDGRPFEITAPSKHRHPRITAHRSQNIERTILHGIPVTPKPRTVIDLARVEDERVVKRALRAAKFSAAQLEQLPKSILDLGTQPTRSPLEDRLYDFVVRSGLERPLANPPYRLTTRTVYPDLYWPQHRLVVEVDSIQWHDDPLARREDAERHADLEAAGERVLRVTSTDMKQPRRVLARLHAAGVREA
jgi:uncharacterized protein DUF559